MSDMKIPRVDTFFAMTHSMSESDSFATRHIARRGAAFYLMAVEITEIVSHIISTPTDATTKLGIIVGKKMFRGSKQETWEGKWQPLQTLKKVAALILGLLSTILIGWWAPSWNHKFHEKLGIISTPVKPVVPEQKPPTPSTATPTTHKTPAADLSNIHIARSTSATLTQITIAGSTPASSTPNPAPAASAPTSTAGASAQNTAGAATPSPYILPAATVNTSILASPKSPNAANVSTSSSTPSQGSLTSTTATVITTTVITATPQQQAATAPATAAAVTPISTTFTSTSTPPAATPSSPKLTVAQRRQQVLEREREERRIALLASSTGPKHKRNPTGGNSGSGAPAAVAAALASSAPSAVPTTTQTPVRTSLSSLQVTPSTPATASALASIQSSPAKAPSSDPETGRSDTPHPDTAVVEDDATAANADVSPSESPEPANTSPRALQKVASAGAASTNEGNEDALTTGTSE